MPFNLSEFNDVLTVFENRANYLAFFIIGGVATPNLFAIKKNFVALDTGINPFPWIIIKNSKAHGFILLDVSLSHGSAARENSFPQAHYLKTLDCFANARRNKKATSGCQWLCKEIT
ncbi:hypothetical protein N4G41_10435 [Kosakonia sacchari]|uniref:hypothetical protein n=1 Tax=Kosakonia sacchari TaxID=1158459 RepID=UPI002ACE5E00|nr:hypothetical protein [Kosakonia sacchari]MDZ7322050.1 hypothetical protein [Kosakonia sacchari]